MNYKIVADSSCDLLALENVAFASAPLKISTSVKEYVDDANLDVTEMVTDLFTYKGKSSTACPGVGDWLDAFGDADRIFCITISGSLSGSYNAAMLAKQDYEEAHPDRKVFVINSLSAGPELRLLIEKIAEMIQSGAEYDEICTEITKYQKKTHLLFMLESEQ